ncbi:hypothetical protein ACFVMC_28820 [Nocardia sp. NPDC127579]|uniref:hypothetical protein n=1 Tax=Nocardia sp. NPDC127579 TaxID=3345402 RepID=UPI00362A4BB6
MAGNIEVDPEGLRQLAAKFASFADRIFAVADNSKTTHTMIEPACGTDDPGLEMAGQLEPTSKNMTDNCVSVGKTCDNIALNLTVAADALDGSEHNSTRGFN